MHHVRGSISFADLIPNYCANTNKKDNMLEAILGDISYLEEIWNTFRKSFCKNIVFQARELTNDMDYNTIFLIKD